MHSKVTIQNEDSTRHWYRDDNGGLVSANMKSGYAFLYTLSLCREKNRLGHCLKNCLYSN